MFPCSHVPCKDLCSVCSEDIYGRLVILHCNILRHFNTILYYSDERKMDHVLQETERNRQMANQIAYRTFTAHGLDEGMFPTGPKVLLS